MQSKSTSRKDLIRAVVFLVIGLLTLGLLIVALGGVRFWEELDYYLVRFDTVKDLSVGRPVKYQGIQAGRVESIGVDPDDPGMIRVRIGVESGFALYEGTTASISQKGLVGDNFVSLMLSGPPGKRLEPGAMIPGESTPDMNAVVARIGAVIEDLGPRIVRIAENVETFVSKENSENLSKTIARAPELMEKMERSMDEIESTIANMERDWGELAGAAAQGIDEGRLSVERVSKDVTATLEEVRSAVNAAASNWNRTLDVTRGHIDAAGGNVAEITERFKDDWDYDQERLEYILENLAELTAELKLLSRSLRERPWQIIHAPEKGVLP